jgi:phosphomannomutase
MRRCQARRPWTLNIRTRDTAPAFGGEVSDYYHVRDFYCADSATLPALLILALLSADGKRMSELLEPLRSGYLLWRALRGVADQDVKMRETKIAIRTA